MSSTISNYIFSDKSNGLLLITEKVKWVLSQYSKVGLIRNKSIVKECFEVTKLFPIPKLN